MKLDDIYGPVRDDLRLVESRLLEETASLGEADSGATAQVVNAGGKRLRPALLLMAAKACSYSGERSISLATAVELVHTASLIHDDIIDDASSRRGVPSVNCSAGNALSVLMGDYVYSKVMAIVVEDGDVEILRCVARATGRMVQGELLQIGCLKDATTSEEKYLAIIAGKTAALLSCACRVGAMLREPGNGQVEVLSEYGSNFGMAFQITDDVLDLTGEEERTGKALGSDIREGRLTLPFIRAMSVADSKDRKRMGEAFTNGGAEGAELCRIREMVEHYRGIEYSLDKAKEYSRACREKLEAVDESESRDSLALLADYVVGRIC